MRRNVPHAIRRLLPLALAALLLGAALAGCGDHIDFDGPGSTAAEDDEDEPEDTDEPEDPEDEDSEDSEKSDSSSQKGEPNAEPTAAPTATPQPEPFIPMLDLPAAVLPAIGEEDLPVFSLGDRRYIAVNRYEGPINAGVGSTIYVQDMASGDTRLFAEVNEMGAIEDIFLAGDKVLVFGWPLDANWPFPTEMCWMVFDANTAAVVRPVEMTDIVTKNTGVGVLNSLAISDGNAMYFGRHPFDPETFEYKQNEYYRMDASLEPQLMFTSDQYYEFAFVDDGWLYLTSSTATQDLPAPLQYAARYNPKINTLEEIETPPSIDPYDVEYPPPPYPINIYMENGRLQVEYYDETASPYYRG